MDDVIWIEKYRPKILDDVTGQDDIIKHLKVYVGQMNFPNLMFSGPPGCVTGDSVIFTDRGLITIKELYDKRIKNIKVMNYNGSEISYNEIDEYFNLKDKDIIKIKTKFGFELKCTVEHWVTCLDSDGTLKFKEAKDLKEGDIVPISYGYNNFGANVKMRFDEGQTFLIDIPDNMRVGSIDYGGGDTAGYKGSALTYPYLMNSNLAEFLGYYISEGNIDKRRVYITNTDKKINERVQYLFETLFLRSPELIIEKRKENTDYGRCLSSIGLVKFLSRLKLDVKSKDKEVPKEILMSSKEVHISFLRALYSGDGSIIKEKRCVDYTSMSKKLCKQVQLMLLNLGIYSSLTEKDAYCSDKYCGKSCAVTIYGDNVLRFRDVIGFTLEYRQKDLIDICKIIENRSGWTNRTLRGINNFLNKIYEEFKRIGRLGYLKKDILIDNEIIVKTYRNAKEALAERGGASDINELTAGDKSPSKERLKKILNILRECNYMNEYKYLMDLCSLNVEYETIESVSYGKENVYDLTIKNIHHYIANGFIVHNSGKTTTAIAMAKEIFGDAWIGNFKEINASDERGINVVRGQIKEYASTKPVGKFPFKILFLDECDALTTDAQSALRRTMEKFSSSCKFILSCNYSSKIIEPIQSRCVVYRFKGISPYDMKERLKYVAEKESLTIDEPSLDAIVYVAEGDMRKAINSLEVASLLEKSITIDSIYKSSGLAHPKDVRELIEFALAGNFISCINKLDILMFMEGLSGEDIVHQLFKEIMLFKMNDKMKIDIIDKIGECDFRISEGSNPVIQLKWMITQIMKIGK